MKEGRISAPARYGFAVLTVALAALIKLLLPPIQEATPFLVFFGAVMLAAWIGGRGPGLLATGLSALTAEFLFLTPAYSFAITPSQGVQMIIFVLEGVVGSSIVAAMHSSRRQSEERAMEVRSRTVELEETNDKLRESEERFRGLSEEAVEGLVLSEDGEVFDANGSFTRMFGYGSGEVIGMDAKSSCRPSTGRQSLVGS